MPHPTYSLKVRKKAKIRNRYNQVPHLSQDTIWNVTNTQENITNKRSMRPALFQQVPTRLQWTDNTAWQTWNINIKKDPQKKHHLGSVNKYCFTGGLKLVAWYQPHPYFWCGSRQIDILFVWSCFLPLKVYCCLYRETVFLSRTQRYSKFEA